MNIIIIFILIIFVSAIISIKKRDLHIVCTKKDSLNKLRSLLKTFDNIATSNDITYWVDGGTLLGAMRHNNIIPWDDDCDIAILESDKNKFMGIKEILNKKGIDISEFWGGYRIFYMNGESINEENRNWNWSKESGIKDRITHKYPFIDIFFVDLIEGKYQFSNKHTREIYKKFYHDYNDLFPLKRQQFADFHINIPNNPKKYLDRGYGNNWDTIGYKNYDHQNMQFKEPVPFRIIDIKC